MFWLRNNFGLMPYVPVNSYGHVRTVSSLTILFTLASLTEQLTSILVLTTTLLESAEGRRMAVEIISCSISMKVWDQARIKLAASGSAGRHVTDCAMRPVLRNKKNNSGLCTPI